ncbi:putative methyltransferase-domain-containing protein [Mycena galericulata]|nr:putative methyltransferase-domain-containing protein [Mycena galericulata]
MNPNFPQNLNIRPSVPLDDAPASEKFNFANQQEAIRVFGIAGKVWEAAYVLNSYIRPPAGHVFDPPLFPESDEARRVIIELGSGSGIVAATMAEVLHRTDDIILATDLPEVCPLLEQNLRAHDTGQILVRPLSWGNSEHAARIADELSKSTNAPGFTHIICSDLVYFSELLAPLLRSLIQLSSPPFVVAPGDDQVVVISYKIRSLPKESPFWSAFGLWFEFAPVLVQKTDPGLGQVSPWHRHGADVEDPTFVFVARRRQHSFHWTLPPDDEDLMQGIMAGGTLSPKSDDTVRNSLAHVVGWPR